MFACGAYAVSDTPSEVLLEKINGVVLSQQTIQTTMNTFIIEQKKVDDEQTRCIAENKLQQAIVARDVQNMSKFVYALIGVPFGGAGVYGAMKYSSGKNSKDEKGG